MSRQVPSDPLVKLLNDTFGPLGWEYVHQIGELKVNCKVSDGMFFSVMRGGGSLADSAKLFGLEVRNEETKVQDSPGVAAASDRVGQGAGESRETIPPSPTKPSRRVIDESITAASQVIIAKKLKSQEELVAMLQAYGVKSKSQLKDEQAMELLEKLNGVLG